MPHWQPGNLFLAEDAHIGWGALGVLLGLLLHLPVYWAVAMVAILTLGKEAVVDPMLEDAPFWPGGAVDWLFWLLGIGGGAAAALFLPRVMG